MALSPVMRQYLEKKSENEDAILFFRLGDFYEMFFDDALIASRELDLVLTGKQCGEAEKAPMCGVPYHRADQYIGKLVEKGYINISPDGTISINKGKIISDYNT